MKRPLTRSLVSLLFISGFVYFYLKPTVQLPILDSLFIIVAVQVVAMWVGSQFGNGNNSSHMIRILFMAAVTAGVIEFLMKPSNPLGYDGTFLGLVVIETGALAFARMAVKK